MLHPSSRLLPSPDRAVPPSVPAMVRACLDRAPDAPALCDRESLSYAALWHQAGACAGALVRAGVAPGDRVVVWLPKSQRAVVAMLAVWLAGGVLVPANPVLKGPQVAHILADAEARLLITLSGRAALLAADARCWSIDAPGAWEAVLDGGPIDPVARQPADLAALLYTSGSTGRPKGVMLSHANLCTGALSVSHYLGLEPADRVLCVLPFGFDYGLNQLLGSWCVGACAVLCEYLVPGDIPRAVARHAVTVLAGVPPLWIPLSRLDWPAPARASLRTLTNSGGHLPRPTVQALRALFPAARLHLMYGLTEAFRSTTLDPALVDRFPDRIGRAIPFADVVVVRPDGEETAPGEPGELVHLGPLVAGGYWRDPVRTAERFRPPPACRSDAEGLAVWSGDTVVRDADGLLRFVGRTDEMIKSSGYRISPTEVEEAALATGLVAEVVAAGVAHAERGQSVALAAVPAPGLEGASDALLGALRASLPGPLVPTLVLWFERLPRGATGKFDRAGLGARLRAAAETGGDPPAELAGQAGRGGGQ